MIPVVLLPVSESCTLHIHISPIKPLFYQVIGPSGEETRSCLHHELSRKALTFDAEVPSKRALSRRQVLVEAVRSNKLGWVNLVITLVRISSMMIKLTRERKVPSNQPGPKTRGQHTFCAAECKYHAFGFAAPYATSIVT